MLCDVLFLYFAVWVIFRLLLRLRVMLDDDFLRIYSQIPDVKRGIYFVNYGYGVSRSGRSTCLFPGNRRSLASTAACIEFFFFLSKCEGSLAVRCRLTCASWWGISLFTAFLCHISCARTWPLLLGYVAQNWSPDAAVPLARTVGPRLYEAMERRIHPRRDDWNGSSLKSKLEPLASRRRLCLYHRFFFFFTPYLVTASWFNWLIVLLELV